MLLLFKKYKGVLLFIGLFVGSYILLSSLYGWYIASSQVSQQPDAITQLVANQCTAVLHGMDVDARVVADIDNPYMNLFINNRKLGIINEGCNGVSVIILFIAFILAFYQKWKKTVLFILCGSVLIYAINIVRIVFLAIALDRYPEYQDVLHDLVFPGIIYGMVFILWIVWVENLKFTQHE